MAKGLGLRAVQSAKRGLFPQTMCMVPRMGLRVTNDPESQITGIQATIACKMWSHPAQVP